MIHNRINVTSQPFVEPLTEADQASLRYAAYVLKFQGLRLRLLLGEQALAARRSDDIDLQMKLSAQGHKTYEDHQAAAQLIFDILEEVTSKPNAPTKE